MFYKKTIFTIILVLLSGHAQAKPLTMMQKVQHASPMPNLMMLIKMNAPILALSKPQLEVVKDWGANNKERSMQLVKNVMQTEEQMKTLVIKGIEQPEFDQLKEKLLGLRGDLIDIKYRCNTLMKKTLTEKQWAQLMELGKKKSAIVASDREASNEVQAFLRVSPMPKLMLIPIMHEKELALTAEQKKALEAWRLKNMNHWSILFADVLKHEKQITQRALLMDDNNELMKQFDEMAKKRREMAQMSLNCRDNMRNILTDEQWKTVIKLFKSYI